MLKILKAKNVNKIIFSYLNINLVCTDWQCKIYHCNNIDIFLISASKLNETFPEGQFLIDDFFPPCRKDGTDKGGGLLLHVHDHIPSRLVAEMLDFYAEICSDICFVKSSHILSQPGILYFR